MELLRATHPDFVLTVESDHFAKAVNSARKNLGAESLVSAYWWIGDASVALSEGLECTEIQNGGHASAVFYDNADYPLWVEFSADVSDARISLPGRRVKNSDSNAKEAWAFRKGMLSGFINYGNEIGRSYLRIDYTLANGEKRTWQLGFEVLSSKLDYHRHWRTIISDIEAEYRMLSLDFLRRTFHTFNPESGGQSIDIIWWNVFKSMHSSFVSAVKMILDRPRHRLRDVPEYARADKIKRFTPSLEEEYARYRKDESHLYQSQHASNSNDTLENRFLRYALSEIYRRYHRLLGRIRAVNDLPDEVLAEMDLADAELHRLSRHPFFRSVGRFSGLTQESQVLQKALGYSAVYRTWSILNKSYSLEEGLHNLETKDIATLYEIWCFIQVKKIVEEQFGPGVEVDNRSRIELNHAFAYSLSRGQESSVLFRSGEVELAELIYNPQESAISNSGSGIRDVVSHTVPQRPDIVLRLTKDDIESGMKMTYLFDAKYRIGSRYSNGVDTPPDDAINQMHRYRDALYYVGGAHNCHDMKKEVVGGYILFPGAGDSDDVAKARFVKSVEDVNIGAFPLRPGDTANRALLGDFIKGLMGRNSRQLLTDKNVIPQKGLKYDYADHAGDDYVLIGYYDEKYWPAIVKNSLYYVRAGLRHGSLRLAPGYDMVKYLLLHSGGNRMLLRVKEGGPRVVSGADIRAKGFSSEGDYYIAYSIESFDPVEIEGFNVAEVEIRGIGSRTAEPYIVPLVALMRMGED